MTIRDCSRPLKGQGNALANPDAETHQGAGLLLSAQSIRGSHHQTRTAGAERMPERERAAVAVDMLGIVGQSETTRTREHWAAKASLISPQSKSSRPRPIWLAICGLLALVHAHPVRSNPPLPADERGEGCVSRVSLKASCDANSRAHHRLNRSIACGDGVLLPARFEFSQLLK